MFREPTAQALALPNDHRENEELQARRSAWAATSGSWDQARRDVSVDARLDTEAGPEPSGEDKTRSSEITPSSPGPCRSYDVESDRVAGQGLNEGPLASKKAENER